MTFLLITVLATAILPSFSSALSPTFSVQVTTPQRYSLSLGISSGNSQRYFGPSSGILLRVEPGISGGKIHIGTRSAFSLAFLPAGSVDLTGALLQTWGDPPGSTGSGQTFVGAECRWGINFIVATAGYYRHIAGDGEDGWLTSLGAGVGL